MCNTKCKFKCAVHQYMNHTALYYTKTQTGDAQVMRQQLHAALSKAISEQCGCYFPVEHIRAGVFRCWGSAATAEVTYRASLTGTRTHTAEELVGYLASWVSQTSGTAVVKVDGFEIQVKAG